MLIGQERVFDGPPYFSCAGCRTVHTAVPAAFALLPSRSQPMEAAMERYIHQANIDLYRRLIAESERNPVRDENSTRIAANVAGRRNSQGQKTR
jgi:hypothetical protein